jgi:hypothetical protein
VNNNKIDNVILELAREAKRITQADADLNARNVISTFRETYAEFDRESMAHHQTKSLVGCDV